MKTLLITGALFVSGILVIVAIHNDEIHEQHEYAHQSANQHLVDSLKREIRFGPKPYFFVHHISPRTEEEFAQQHDSLMRYLSHFTVGEIKEIKDGIIENYPLKGFLDTVLSYKDSLHYALTGAHLLSNDD